MKKNLCFISMLFFASMVYCQTCTIKVKMDSCKYTIINKDVYNNLQTSNSDLKKNYDNLLAEYAVIQTRLSKLKVDEFLNIQDTSIFGCNFIMFDENIIPARSRNFYKLIQNIHDLNAVLNQKSVGGTYSEVLKTAKENTDKAYSIINTIITTTSEEVFTWLSESQIAYYRQLINQYNELIETIK